MGVLNPFSWFNRSNVLSENYSPTFDNYRIGDSSPIYINLDNLDRVYNEIPHLQSVINNIAGMVSNGVWKAIDKDGNESTDALALKAIERLNNPSVTQSGKFFLFQTSVNEDIYGNSFIYCNKAFDNDLIPYQVTNLKDIQVVPTGKFYDQTNIEDIIKHYKFDNGTTESRTFDPKEVIHIRTEGSGELVSESKIKTLHQQLSNIKSAYESRNVLITKRGGIGIISVGGSKGTTIPMSPKEKEATEKKFESNYGTGKDQRKTLFTTSPVTYTPTNFMTKDLMLFEEIRDDVNAICNVYGYNANLLKEEGAKFENVKESLKMVYQDTVIPRANKYAQIFTGAFGLGDRGIDLVLDFSHIPVLQENEKEKAEVLSTKVDAFQKLISIPSENIDTETAGIKQYLLNLLKS